MFLYTIEFTFPFAGRRFVMDVREDTSLADIIAWLVARAAREGLVLRGELRLFFSGRELQREMTLREAWRWHTYRESHTRIQVLTNLRRDQPLAAGHADNEGENDAEDEEGSEGGGQPW